MLHKGRKINIQIGLTNKKPALFWKRKKCSSSKDWNQAKAGHIFRDSLKSMMWKETEQFMFPTSRASLNHES